MTQSASANIELVRSIYEAYSKRDLATAFALLDEQIEIVQTTDLPWGGHYRGLEEVRQFFARIAAAVEATPEASHYFTAGDDVVVIGKLRGRAKANGNPIDLDIVHIWTVRNQRIVKFRAFIDTPAMLQALSAKPLE